MGQWEEQRDEIFSLSLGSFFSTRLVFCCVSSRPLGEGREEETSLLVFCLDIFGSSETAAEIRQKEKVHPKDANRKKRLNVETELLN